MIILLIVVDKIIVDYLCVDYTLIIVDYFIRFRRFIENEKKFPPKKTYNFFDFYFFRNKFFS